MVERHLDELVALSHRVHATPELCFEETTSARAVAETLRAGGLAVDEGVVRPADGARVPSRRTGTWWWRSAPSTTRSPRWAMPAGTTSSPRPLSAPGLALAAVADDLGLTVRVLGTPAEEGGGGQGA